MADLRQFYTDERPPDLNERLKFYCDECRKRTLADEMMRTYRFV